MPTKTPIVTCVMRSAKNVRSTRGLNWLDASCSATIVIENVSPATVIREPAITDSTVRAADASPLKAYHAGVTCSLSSSSTRPIASSANPTRKTAGMNARLPVRSLARSVSRRIGIASADPARRVCHSVSRSRAAAARAVLKT